MAVFGIPESILILYAVSLLIPVVVIIVFDALRLGKINVLYFETEKLVRILRVRAKDGIIKIQNKHFSVDKSNTAMMPEGIIIRGLNPMLVIKWNRVMPLKFTAQGITGITPENLKALTENKTFDRMLQRKSEDKTILMFMGIGLLIGALAGYIYGSGAGV